MCNAYLTKTTIVTAHFYIRLASAGPYKFRFRGETKFFGGHNPEDGTEAPLSGHIPLPS